jgi:hypothetical protein
MEIEIQVAFWTEHEFAISQWHFELNMNLPFPRVLLSTYGLLQKNCHIWSPL